jgi:hypothetical protein
MVGIPTALFIFRFIRMLEYRKQWVSGPEEERKVARSNFFIHLVTCVILFLIILGLVYWFSEYLKETLT